MKVLLLLCMLATSLVLSYDEDFALEDAIQILSQLTEAEYRELLRGEGIVMEERREITGLDGKLVQIDDPSPRSPFCCTQQHIQNKVWNTKQQTKIVYEYKHVTFNYRNGYTKCGLFGWQRCSQYKQGYSSELFTYTQVVILEDVKLCPDEHITCCSGYARFADGNCVSLDDLKKNPGLLCRLAKLGSIKLHEGQKPKNCTQ